nr:MAG TPA: hypothetical protein [Caudoviricetes sp.]DAO73995.1 MAG TPA: hypothetical protein [Caudoviricetes sp.]
MFSTFYSVALFAFCCCVVIEIMRSQILRIKTPSCKRGLSYYFLSK